MTATQATVKTAPKIPSQIQLPSTIRRVVLAGFMGSGKTSVGRLLAEALGWNFLDLDDHLEARAGAKIADIFTQNGEAHFRRLESSALANALTRSATVLALGGGAPEELTNRLLLEQTPGTLVIFLEAPFPTLFDRCMLQSFASPDHIRPVLASPQTAEIRFNQRQPHYRRLARITVATADLTPAQAAEVIIKHLTAV